MAFNSPKIVSEVKTLYGSDAKEIKVEMRHARAVQAYVQKIEQAHKKTAKSKLSFR